MRRARVRLDMADALQSLDALTWNFPKEIQPAVADRQLIPDKPQWNRMIKKALRTIREGELKKIVLARKKVITHRDLWNPAQIIASLSRIQENSFTVFLPGR